MHASNKPKSQKGFDSPSGNKKRKPRSLRLRLEELNARKSSNKFDSPLAKSFFDIADTDLIGKGHQ
jgi:hypothetical protein